MFPKSDYESSRSKQEALPTLKLCISTLLVSTRGSITALTNRSVLLYHVFAYGICQVFRSVLRLVAAAVINFTVTVAVAIICCDCLVSVFLVSRSP